MAEINFKAINEEEVLDLTGRMASNKWEELLGVLQTQHYVLVENLPNRMSFSGSIRIAALKRGMKIRCLKHKNDENAMVLVYIPGEEPDEDDE